MKPLRHLFLFAAIIGIVSCHSEQTKSSTPNLAKAVATSFEGDPFKDYWYQGKAEITSYDLDQARYGENHQGHATLIFVTEEFSKSKQVKLDNPSANHKDAVPILKLNRTAKFNTGIYPYSMMNSTFTPVDLKKYPHSLKVTASSQEWCGHTFMQINEKRNKYAVQLNSYFEQEGDVKFEVEKVLLEDELWNRLRINPKSLPTGTVKLIPAAFFTRLKHTELKARSAQAMLKEDPSNADLMIYSLEYPALKRNLAIHFQKAFPHQIEGWTESYVSGFGAGAKTLTTKATKKKSIMLDYWSRNGNADAPLRAELGYE